jgi:hypothetical protein
VNHPNIARGRQVRRALMSVARECHAKGLLMPSYAMLGGATGLSNSQISRHMNRLFDEGALSVSWVGQRFRIKSIRP